MKLILFDIDGTLVHVHSEITQKVFADVVREAFDYHDPVPKMEFHGKTDRQIVLEFCDEVGIDRSRGESRFDDIDQLLIEGWSDNLTPDTVDLLPGVRPLLDTLESMEAVLGLLTGNIEPGARAKLGVYDLNDYFSTGAYGSDSIARVDLPPIAIERASSLNGHRFTPETTLIIGDSHRDIECAQAWRINSFAVATGSLDVKELSRYSPTAVVENLRDTSFIFDFLRS